MTASDIYRPAGDTPRPVPAATPEPIGARIAVVSSHGAPASLVENIREGVASSATEAHEQEDTPQEVVMIEAPSSDTSAPNSLLPVLAELTRRHIREIIVISTSEEVLPGLQRFRANHPEVSVVLAPHDTTTLPAVSLNSYNGGVQATRHLLALGHRQLAHIAGPPGLPHARQREQAFRDICAEAGIEPIAVIAGDWSAESGLVAGRTLRNTPTTAVFCASDQIALGLIRAYKEAGQQVPGHLSVVGYDDENGAARFDPPLTTIRHDYLDLGRQAYALVRSTGREPGRHAADVVPELIVRASTAPFQPAPHGSVL
jgi:DNA-binding LacI/PurR family transcriptional regulator